MASTLDTLQIVKRLREAGFDESQAEAVTGVLCDLRDADSRRRFAVASKTDLDRAHEGSRERLGSKLVMTIEVTITNAKEEIIRWMLGIAFAQAALILAALGGHP